MTVDSAPGHGATFRVHLPQVREVAEREPPRPVSIMLDPGAGTVLLVEDDTDVRDVAADALRIAGYTVLAAGSSSDAIDLSKQHEGPIDLLVTDVVMPQMSGGELTARLTTMRPSLRVLFVSGYTEDAIVQHGVLDPDVELLPKPFGADALVTRVREILGAR